MVKSEEGKVHIKGSIAELLTDLTLIIKAFRAEDWFTEEMLEDCIENSKLNEEQMTEKFQDTLMQKLLEKLQDLDDNRKED